MHIILILIAIIIVFAIIFGPGWWAQQVFRRYSKPRDDIPGTGGQFAEHLLKKLSMKDVKVEETQEGNDHYDPRDKTVRLGANNFNTNSLTAMTVAAHEVGHAIQDFRQENKLAMRSRLVQLAQFVQQFGVILFVLLPIVSMISRSPTIGLIMLAGGVISMAMAVVVHLVTLPVEFDASFNKAMPMLVEGNYLDNEDIPAARRILKAAALTYVAASLMSILNLFRWIAIMRR